MARDPAPDWRARVRALIKKWCSCDCDECIPKRKCAADLEDLLACPDELDALVRATPEDRLQPIAESSADRSRPIYPIPLNAEQTDAVTLWAADDRLWTTQETVEINLRTFARTILKLNRATPDREDV